MNTFDDPANGTTVPNVGIAAARPKPRGKRATLAAAAVSAGLTLFGLGLAAGTAHADPGDTTDAPADTAAPAPPTRPDAPGVTCIPWAPGQPCDSYEEKEDEQRAAQQREHFREEEKRQHEADEARQREQQHRVVIEQQRRQGLRP
jgi:hypothetical protein